MARVYANDLSLKDLRNYFIFFIWKSRGEKHINWRVDSTCVEEAPNKINTHLDMQLNDDRRD